MPYDHREIIALLISDHRYQILVFTRQIIYKLKEEEDEGEEMMDLLTCKCLPRAEEPEIPKDEGKARIAEIAARFIAIFLAGESRATVN